MPTALTVTDIAYQNSEFIVDADKYIDAWLSQSAVFRKAANCELDVSYGDHPRATYDLFMPKGTPLGLMIYVHGGYWKARSKSDWSHFAEGALGKGFAVAMLNYPLAPEVRIREITSFVSFGILTVAARIAGPLYLVGHSAGGHLVARMAMPDVLPTAISSRLARVQAISPVSDLRPLLGTQMNDELRLSKKEAIDESPMLGTPMKDVSVSVVVGAQERPVFLDQARWLSEAWSCEQIILPGCHHFDVIDGLCDPDSQMLRTLLD